MLFTVWLEHVGDAEEVTTGLERMVQDKGLPSLYLKTHDFRRLNFVYLSGCTTQESYEQVFRAKLRYGVQWKEIVRAQVPELYKEKIRNIILENEEEVI